MPGLNTKSLCNAFIVKKYVLFIEIRLSDGDIKSGDPLVLFGKSSLMLAPGVSFTLSHITFTTMTPTYTLILDISPIYIYSLPCNEVRVTFSLRSALK
jgi:hypothetical protein